MYNRVDARPLALLRILFGLLTFATLSGLLPESTFYYSNKGWFPLAKALEVTAAREWSLLHTITSPFGVTAFFCALMSASIGMTVGYRSRLCSTICFIGVVSLHSRNWLNTYGGDAVLRLMLFYLAVAPAGAAWSIDALIKRLRANASRLERDEVNPLDLRRHRPTTVEAWSLRLIQIQICLIYLTTGLAKLHGAEWVNGTAMGIVLLNPIFSKWNFSFIEGSRFFAAALRMASWTTLVWEVSFPFLMISRYTRYLALAMGVAMHLGIILFLQIHWFGYIMIASYAAFLPKGAFVRIEAWTRILLRRRRGASPVRVIYDGHCGFCRQALAVVAMLDVFRKLELVALQDEARWRAFAPNLERAELERAMHAVRGGGSARAGFDAFALIGTAVPALWPMAALARVPGIRPLGRWVYAHVASSRYCAWENAGTQTRAAS